MRKQRELPVIGSESLFQKIWDSHTEIRQFGAKGHAKCDDCGILQVRTEPLSQRTLRYLSRYRIACHVEAPALSCLHARPPPYHARARGPCYGAPGLRPAPPSSHPTVHM